MAMSDQQIRAAGASVPAGTRPGDWAEAAASAAPRPSFLRILWATDFSACSEAALHFALAVARRYGSHIYLTHIIRPESFEFVVPEAVTAMLEQSRREAEQQMAGLLVTGRLRGVSHQVLIATGDLWPVLSRLVREHDIDLIVLGTHGRTGVRKLLLGSVAQEVFRQAPCPVLTVGPKVHGQAESEPRRILYSTNFSPASAYSARYALSLAREHGAQLTFLHVAEEADLLPPESRARLVESVSKQLRELVPAGEAWLEPELAVEFGSAAEGILKAADQYQAELIVMGVRRPTTLFGRTASGTAYDVVCRSGCPVLTVPGEPTAKA